MEILSRYRYYNNFANNQYNAMFQGNEKKTQYEKWNDTQVMYVIEHRYELNVLKSQECDFHHSPV